jgi:phage replication-related protein YjqB (UPF0714/DUF867 family)
MDAVNRDPITFAELLARPGVEEQLDLRGRFGFCAFHGGNLERRTDEIAAEAARRSGASYYGVRQPDGMRHHLPSARVRPEESDKLAAFVDRCAVVVTVHGYGRWGQFTSLLIGGRNRSLATHVAGCVRGAVPAYRTIDDLDRIPRALRGLHPRNPCNLPVGGGVQLELPPRVRGLSPLADHWPGMSVPGARFSHLERLIEGLATAASTWPGTR